MYNNTMLFHLFICIIGVVGYHLHKIYIEKALIRSIYLCIDKGEVEEMGSVFGYSEYIVRRGYFHFLIKEVKLDDFYYNSDISSK